MYLSHLQVAQALQRRVGQRERRYKKLKTSDSYDVSRHPRREIRKGQLIQTLQINGNN